MAGDRNQHCVIDSQKKCDDGYELVVHRVENCVGNGGTNAQCTVDQMSKDNGGEYKQTERMACYIRPAAGNTQWACTTDGASQ